MIDNTRRIEEIRKATFGIQVRDPIVRSINRKLKEAKDRLDVAEAKHVTRVVSVSTEPISGRPNYYIIGFTRADHS